MLESMVVSFDQALIFMQKAWLAKGILCILSECCSVPRFSMCSVAEEGEMHQTKQSKTTTH